MGKERGSAIERILHRVEDHVERWRQERQERLGEVEAGRDWLFEEAAERERRLARAVSEAAELALSRPRSFWLPTAPKIQPWLPGQPQISQTKRAQSSISSTPEM